MDPAQSFAAPDPVHKGTTEYFTLGGIWLRPTYVKNVTFRCKLYGIQVYRQKFKVEEHMNPGFWQH